MLIIKFSEIYRNEHLHDFPFAENGDEHIHEVIREIKGIKFKKFNGEFYYALNENALMNFGKRKGESPPNLYNTTPSKRSRSAPDVEDENKENHQGRGRQVKRNLKVTFGDYKVKNEYAPRSKSEHQPTNSSTVRIFYFIILKNNFFIFKGLTSFQNCVLIGDDFLLGFSMIELKQKPIKENGILQSGLCFSGLTISTATEKIREIKKPNFNKAIVYLGSFDIVNGKELIELMNDYEIFVKECKSKKINAVACTLAPLPRHEEGNRKATLEGFNKYLKTKSGLSVIDVNKVFCGLKKEDSFNLNCYIDHRRVSGSKKQVTLWSAYGTQEFRRTVLKSLGFALIAEKPGVI